MATKQGPTNGQVKAGYRTSEFIAGTVVGLLILVLATFLCWHGKLDGVEWTIAATSVPGGMVVVYTMGRAAIKTAVAWRNGGR